MGQTIEVLDLLPITPIRTYPNNMCQSAFNNSRVVQNSKFKGGRVDRVGTSHPAYYNTVVVYFRILLPNKQQHTFKYIKQKVCLCVPDRMKLKHEMF